MSDFPNDSDFPVMSVAEGQNTSIGAPELLAHRGYAARYPENTREAIRAAVEAGARNIEFDIQLSQDRVPHLLHDDSFMRTGNNPARIMDIDSAAVATVGVGENARLNNQFAAVVAPPLAVIVQDLQDLPEVTAFVELKRQSISHFGLDVVLDEVLAVLAPVLQQCVIISFDIDAVRAARQRTEVPIGWALRSWDDEHRLSAEELQPEYLFCNVTRLPAAPVPLWLGSWTWVVYEIVDADLARDLVGRGVGMLETMAIGELATQLAAEQ
jgi:glycerophosphoryl diester phosphodiesterase